MDVEQLASIVIDSGLKIHQALGPGLLESAYEAVLAAKLQNAGLFVERQKPVPIIFDNLSIDEGFRADMLIEGKLLIELKAVSQLAPVHGKQVLTYLRFLDLPLGLLLNFGEERFATGVRRIVNGHGEAQGKVEWLDRRHGLHHAN